MFTKVYYVVGNRYEGDSNFLLEAVICPTLEDAIEEQERISEQFDIDDIDPEIARIIMVIERGIG